MSDSRGCCVRTTRPRSIEVIAEVTTLNTPDRIHNALLGVGLLYLSMWCLSTLDATGKWLMGIGAPLITVVWMRYVSHLVLMSLLVLPRKGLRVLRSQTIRFQILRAMAMLIASLCLFPALMYLPQAQATAIAFLAPLIMLALAPWLLGEPRKRSRWIAGAIGFLGVLIVIRPGAGLDPIGVLFALATAVFFALQHICTRKVAVDNPFTTLIWSGLVGTVLMTIALLFTINESWPVLQQLTMGQWLLMVSLGLSGGMGHLLQIQAYQNAPASLLAPFMYLQISAATMLGWLIWGDFPDRLTWVGIGVICASGAGIGLYEWHQRKTR